MTINKDKVLQFIKFRGPTLPVDLTREYGGNTIIVGAVLSELTQSGQLVASNVKVGGSPLYYSKEHASRLQNYSKHLNHKDQEAYNYLKQVGIVYDYDLTPLMRVSMRQIKDFAIPVTVSINNKNEMFWRWYMTPLSQLEHKIKERFGIVDRKPEARPDPRSEPRPEAPAPVQQAVKKPEVIQQQAGVQSQNPTTSSKEEFIRPVEQIKPNMTLKPKSESVDKRPQEGIKTEENTQTLKETEPLQSKKPEVSSKKISINDIIETEAQKERREKSTSSQQTLSNTAEEPEEIVDEFHDKICKLLDSKGVKIDWANVIRKNSEIEYVVDVPAVVGMIRFYARAKSKQKINDGDIGSAFVEAQQRRLPTLIISSGNLTKKAQELLERDTSIKLCSFED